MYFDTTKPHHNVSTLAFTSNLLKSICVKLTTVTIFQASRRSGELLNVDRWNCKLLAEILRSFTYFVDVNIDVINESTSWFN